MFPTILELAGIDYTLDEKQPGTSFKPLLEGEKTGKSDEEVFIYDEYGGTRMVQTQQYKYVLRFPDGSHELYDLIADPHEQNNLYFDKKYESIIVSLKGQLFRWFSTYMTSDKDGTINPATRLGQLEYYDTEKEQDIFYQPVYDNPLTLLRKRTEHMLRDRRRKNK